MNDGDKFSYTYSAPTELQRREIESIKKQYETAPAGDGKLGELRRLDNAVRRPPLVLGIVLGVVGVLVLGLGMTMVLEWDLIVWGVVVGVVGIGVCAAAYPVYGAVLKRNRKKYGQRIIDLSNEILKG